MLLYDLKFYGGQQCCWKFLLHQHQTFKCFLKIKTISKHILFDWDLQEHNIDMNFYIGNIFKIYFFQ